MFTILGIDPGSRVVGFGVITVKKKGSNDLSYQSSGCIRVAHIPLLIDRLPVVFQDINTLIQKHRPDVMAIEQVFVNKNARSALVLGHARGAIMVAAGQYGIPIAEYATRLVKERVTGYGSAQKLQVCYMVQKILQIQHPIASLDASDALAVAICHAYHQQYKEPSLS